MDRLSSSFAEAWTGFQALGSLRLVGDTLEGEWTRGRTDYLVFLVRVEDAAAGEHVARIIERLAGIPGLEPYPETYWHVTVKLVGFRVPSPQQPDELSPAAAEAIAAAARSALASEPAFAARIGRPNGFEGVVFLEVLDAGRLAALNARLLERVPGLTRAQFDSPHFLPHVSIARFASNDGLAQLKSTLAALRSEAAAGPTFTVRRVDLISARLSAAAPTFDVLASYDLQEH